MSTPTAFSPVRPLARALLPITCCLLLAGTLNSRAVSGTWTNLSSSIWGDPTNWLNGFIADGVGDTADFSTINLPGDVTVSLDTSRTNTNLTFGDTDPTGSPGSWILDNAGNPASLLELAGTTPTITVNQLGPAGSNTNVVTISAVIDGTNGLTKAGTGILNLTVANTYTNGTFVNGGTIVMSTTAATFGSNIIINNPIVVPTGQTRTIYMGNRMRLASSGNAATITGGGTLNFVVNTTVTRDDIGSAAGAFAGVVNYVGSG